MLELSQLLLDQVVVLKFEVGQLLLCLLEHVLDALQFFYQISFQPFQIAYLGVKLVHPFRALLELLLQLHHLELLVHDHFL
jgi:hypothetical protein